MCVLLVYHPYCRKMFIKMTPTADVADLMTINQSVNPRSHFTEFVLVFADLASVFPAHKIPIPNTPQTAWLCKTSAVETTEQSIKLATKSNVDWTTFIRACMILVMCSENEIYNWKSTTFVFIPCVCRIFPRSSAAGWVCEVEKRTPGTWGEEEKRRKRTLELVNYEEIKLSPYQYCIFSFILCDDN